MEHTQGDSLPVQLHDTMLSSKLPVSAHEDSLSLASRITCSHMEAHVHRNSMDVVCKCLKTIQLSYQQLAETCSRVGCSMTYDLYSYIRLILWEGGLAVKILNRLKTPLPFHVALQSMRTIRAEVLKVQALRARKYTGML